MKTLFLLSHLFLLIKCAHGYSCLHSDTSYYNVDESSNCTVYHHCTPSGMVTLRCSEGEAFDYLSSKCIEAFLVDCGEHSQRSRRSTPPQSSLLGKLILPIIDEMMSDPATKQELRYIFNVAKSSYNGVRQEFLKSRVRRETVLLAKRQFMSRTKSTMEKLLDKHFMMVLRKIIGNIRVLFSSMGTVEANSGSRSAQLKAAAADFVRKHNMIMFGSLYLSFASQETIAQMKRDFVPLKYVAFDIIDDYLNEAPHNRWLWFIYDRNSFVSRNF